MARDLPGYLKKVRAGETLLVTDGERAVAEIKPVRQEAASTNGERPLGFARGEFTVPDAFFEPLPENELGLWEGRNEGGDETAA